MSKDGGNITLVSPPDYLHSECKAISLINLSKQEKDEFAGKLVGMFPTQPFTIYTYNGEHDVSWPINVSKLSDINIVNYDNTVNQFNEANKVILGIILSQPNTYFTCSNIDYALKLQPVNPNLILDWNEFMTELKNMWIDDIGERSQVNLFDKLGIVPSGRKKGKK
jgi:hypothetical protein